MAREVGGASAADRSDLTRTTLVRTARALFGSKGYAATGTEELVHTAGVSRGALYHHFRDKRAVFEAVFGEVQAELREAVTARWNEHADDPSWERLRAAAHRYLDLVTEPETQRIVVLDAPSVLGPRLWRKSTLDASLAALAEGLRVCAEEGRLARDVSLPAAAHVLLGVFTDAAHWVGIAGDVPRARREAETLIDRMLDSLLEARASDNGAGPLPVRTRDTQGGSRA